jgi:hypothetical protein
MMEASSGCWICEAKTGSRVRQDAVATATAYVATDGLNVFICPRFTLFKNIFFGLVLWSSIGDGILAAKLDLNRDAWDHMSYACLRCEVLE